MSDHSECYLPSHEWARPQADGSVVIGLSSFAAGEVGEIIHVSLPKPGTVLTRGAACAEIESVKSVNDFYSPIDGTVLAVNGDLASKPELVNQDALGKGWFAVVKPATAQPLAGLLDAATYVAKTRA